MFFERGTIAFFHKWDDKFLFTAKSTHKAGKAPTHGGAGAVGD